MALNPNQKAWLRAALLSAALLILPMALWLFLPGPTRFVVEPNTEVHVETAPTSEQPAPTATQPQVARPATPPKTVAVRGVVLDPSGKGIEGALVGCNDGSSSSKTDAEGRFELSPEADGCTAIATHKEHSPSEPTRLDASRDNTLQLMGRGGIAGIVVDERGSPVEHYLLAIESFVPSGDDASAGVSGRPRKISDPGGAFVWEQLAAGFYVLTASADGRPPAKSDRVEVEAGKTTYHVRIVLVRGAKLTGRVVDAETGKGIKEAQVNLDSVTSSGANAISLVLTDEAGNFEMEGVPREGPFSIRVSRDGYLTKIVPGLESRGGSPVRADVELRAQGDGGSRQELAGIGASLAPSPRGVMIARVLDDSPAEKAGLERGDILVRIDGTDAKQMPLSDCVQRLRGAEGTRVSVSVERDGRVVEVTIQRDIVVH